ncbi:bifunctional peptidase and (3S)-lysyl hydroxylase Jmjd7-like [Haliotis rufescens]|uniref:bifunctional peptidase and (3S)-lysyl hydroxylase Jmjd7-like n=1 Tax=Haliotis rufescens TaxID=6454 RepID=UPI001EAFCCF5|nr:bifunctional peptidase and (3S)-lysyl hydroxylase Jmjd7-like [Haliotis rufescens]
MSEDEPEDLTAAIKQQFLYLASEARELYLDSEVPLLTSPPTPLTFYRQYVAPNKPVLIRGLTDHWPALSKWSPDYFRKTIGELEVTVTATPNGYADAVTEGKFVMPEEQRMTMSEFLDHLDKGDNSAEVYYIQKQNSNLTEEFTSIISDVEPNLKLGSEAFGRCPDAVNFWMGDGRAITSMHRDHYENLYCVVSGWKKFILIPPTDVPFIPYGEYQAAAYSTDDDGNFHIVDDEEAGQVPWISIDPLNPDLKKYPQYASARPIEVVVQAGETLYLPSLWFHHVQQSHACIAVNYWYDMDFDIRYNYFKFVEKVKEIVS